MFAGVVSDIKSDGVGEGCSGLLVEVRSRGVVFLGRFVLYGVDVVDIWNQISEIV